MKAFENLQNKYELGIGTLEPRKNLSRLVEAWRLLDGELAKMRLKKISDYVMSETYQRLAPGGALFVVALPVEGAAPASP